MRQQNDELSMPNVRGSIRMCTSTTGEFRARVKMAAIQEGITSQEFVLRAVLARIKKKGPATPQDRRESALRTCFESKRTPQHIKDAIDNLLKPYLPAAKG